MPANADRPDSPDRPDRPDSPNWPNGPNRLQRPDHIQRMVEIIERAERPTGGTARPGAAMAVPGEVRHLDTEQLAAVSAAIRHWTGRNARPDVRASRLRVLLAYLLLRWTGAKLGEVLALDDRLDLDLAAGVVHFRKESGQGEEREQARDKRRDGRQAGREVRLPEPAVREMAEVLADPGLARFGGELLRLDPAHIRRKLYERAQECGLPREALNPTVLRRSRAIELLRADVPLTIVQSMLGQASPDLTASLVEFSDEDARRIMARTMEREARRTSSARNAFFGKVAAVRRGDIQAEVEVATLGGLRVVSVVTTRSIDDLGLRTGTPVVAEVKAPLVSLVKAGEPYPASIENRLIGVVSDLRLGEITSEVMAELADGTRMAAIITTRSVRRLELKQGSQVGVLFSAFAVVLKVD